LQRSGTEHFLHATVYVYTQFAECTSTDCKCNGITTRNFERKLPVVRSQRNLIIFPEEYSVEIAEAVLDEGRSIRAQVLAVHAGSVLWEFFNGRDAESSRGVAVLL
jgi:hypothetical protein